MTSKHIVIKVELQDQDGNKLSSQSTVVNLPPVRGWTPHLNPYALEKIVDRQIDYLTTELPKAYREL